mmetsp:Transcript_20730/g.48162  ORF Transcript_20730/g.48162 Transcript_20730/m.48162 type:complete len:198 (+) Transcript_20730:60-653(+)
MQSMMRKSTGPQLLFCLVLAVVACFLSTSYPAPSAQPDSAAFALLRPSFASNARGLSAPGLRSSRTMMFAEKSEAPAEVEEEEDDEPSELDAVTEEQIAIIDALIADGVRNGNLTEVVKEQLMYKVLAETKVDELENSVDELSETNEDLLSKIKEVAGQTGVGGIAGIMMNFMSVEDIVDETKQNINTLKNPPRRTR